MLAIDKARRALAGLDTGARLFVYIVLAPIILVGAVLVSVALYFIFGWLTTTSWAGRYYSFVVSHFSLKK